MRGWCADFFRLWWGLLYWNARKSWFQLRRGRCPCQHPSDSGRAYETQCDACVTWHRPARFQRVCPLLVPTKDGLRCSANTPEVRPFWIRALGHYGGAGLAIYAVVVLGIFTVLRTIGYPVSIVHIGVPPLWHKVGQARGWFFLDRSNRAFEAGRTEEGLLYLENSYQFDPTNYAAGLALAKHSQLARPAHSDRIFQQLMREHPARRNATAQEWFRALIARGSFEKIVELARDQLPADTAQAPVWVRALVFATRQLPEDAVLRELARSEAPATKAWRPVFEVELALRAGRTAEARALVLRDWPAAPPFTVFYRVNTLIELRDNFAALDLLARFPGALDAEAVLTLQLDALAVGRAENALAREVNALLAQRLGPANLAIVKVLCAHLIRHPDAATFGRLLQKVQRDGVQLNTETAGIWFSLLCTAGAVGDTARLGELTAQLREASKTPFTALGVVEAFFRGETAERRITGLLPLLPLPLEVTYALLERFGSAPALSLPPNKRA